MAYEVRISYLSSDVCSSVLNCSIARLRLSGIAFGMRVAHPGARISSPVATSRIRGRSHTSTRSEEHTSELQSLMRISYAVFCLKKKKHSIQYTATPTEHIHRAKHHNRDS